MDIFLAQLLNALLYAAVLFLIAGGLSLIFGVMRIVNLAHGSLYALGAYVMAWGLGRLAGESGSEPVYLIALLPVAAVAVGATGAVVEPILLRPLYARAEEYQLLLTFGLLLILEDAMRYIWGPTPLTASPLWAAFGTLHLMGATYPRYNVVVILLGMLTAVLLWAFVFKTRFGVMLRATSQNRRMAAALGINVGPGRAPDPGGAVVRGGPGAAGPSPSVSGRRAPHRLACVSLPADPAHLRAGLRHRGPGV